MCLLATNVEVWGIRRGGEPKFFKGNLIGMVQRAVPRGQTKGGYSFCHAERSVPLGEVSPPPPVAEGLCQTCRTSCVFQQPFTLWLFYTSIHCILLLFKNFSFCLASNKQQQPKVSFEGLSVAINLRLQLNPPKVGPKNWEAIAVFWFFFEFFNVGKICVSCVFLCFFWVCFFPSCKFLISNG